MTLALTFSGVSVTRTMVFTRIAECKTEREFKRIEHSPTASALDVSRLAGSIWPRLLVTLKLAAPFCTSGNAREYHRPSNAHARES